MVTEPTQFGGSLDLLSQIIQAVNIPALRKAFVQSRADVKETARRGAKAILLICSCMEEKVEIVRRCLAGELGLCEAERIMDVDHSIIRRWIVRYVVDGVAGLMPRERNRTYSVAVKLTTVQEYLSGAGRAYKNSKGLHCIREELR